MFLCCTRNTILFIANRFLRQAGSGNEDLNLLSSVYPRISFSMAGKLQTHCCFLVKEKQLLPEVYPAYGCANKFVALIFLLCCQFSLINEIEVVFRASPFYHGTYSNISPSVPGSPHRCPFASTSIYIYPHPRHDMYLSIWAFLD